MYDFIWAHGLRGFKVHHDGEAWLQAIGMRT